MVWWRLQTIVAMRLLDVHDMLDAHGYALLSVEIGTVRIASGRVEILSTPPPAG